MSWRRGSDYHGTKNVVISDPGPAPVVARAIDDALSSGHPESERGADGAQLGGLQFVGKKDQNRLEKASLAR